jgi:hypothetical protein
LGAETHVSTADRRWLSPLWLWTSILAGPIAWACDLEISYALVHWTCATQRTPMLHLITLGALLVTVSGMAMAWMALQQTREFSSDGGEERARARFMAILGLSSGFLFACAIVAAAIPRWVLDACQ